MIVIAFHFGMLGITGGFIGVDIFFVISGFVITASIMERLENKSFSLMGYFKSRFFRIFPALAFVTLITLILNAFLLFPVDAERSAYHGLAAIGFVSNFLFWQEVGYFDADSSYKPFLHTWSLAVEWQFYMLWPLAVYILFLLKRFAVALLIAGIGLGILASGLLSNYSNFVFYMMPLRGWEFALGGLIALVPYSHFTRQKFPVLSSLTGFSAILYSSYFFNDDTIFPGFAAAIPCVGTFALLYFKRDYSERVLTIAPLQYLGKISYSLYLVHWPVLILYQHFVFRALGVIDILIMCLITLGLSHLSYLYIEQAFRKPGIHFKKYRAAALLGIVLLSGAVAWFTVSSEGKTGRYGEKENAVINYFRQANDTYHEKYGIYFPKDGQEVWDVEKHKGLPCLYDGYTLNSPDDQRIVGCVIQNAGEQSNKQARVVVLGDSNGKNSYEALSHAFPDIGFSMLMHSGCAAATSYNCFPHIKEQLNFIFQNADVNGVVLSSRYSNQPIEGMADTAAFLNSIDMPFLILGATPTLLRTPDMIMLKKGISLEDEEFILPLDKAYYYDDLRAKNEALEDMATKYQEYFFDKTETLCPESKCFIKALDYETPFYLDTNHLSKDGLKLIEGALQQDKNVQEFISQIKNKKP